MVRPAADVKQQACEQHEGSQPKDFGIEQHRVGLTPNDVRP